MDVSLSNAIVNTSTTLTNAKTADAVNVAVLKKAINVQQTNAAQLLESVAQTAPPPALATSGVLGTKLNTTA